MRANMADLHAPTCPFCPFSDVDASFVEEHINFCHPEGGATQSVDDSRLVQDGELPSSHLLDKADTIQYVDCPHGCGETVTTAELSTHLDLHVAEDIALDETGADSGTYDSDPMNGGYDLQLGIEDGEPLDLPSSRKHVKRGTERDFARNNTSKAERAQNPARQIGPDGAKRLGVCYSIQAPCAPIIR